MAERIRNKVFEAPLHVMPSSDGAVRVLLPDGHSLTLSVEAAERSGLLLSRATGRKVKKTGATVRRRTKVPARAGGTVIAVDFVRQARLH